jgi:hypothetical protein
MIRWVCLYEQDNPWWFIPGYNFLTWPPSDDYSTAEETPFFILPPDPGATTCRQRGSIFHPSSWSRGHHMQAEGMHFSSFLLIQRLPDASRVDPFFILPPDPGATTCRQRGSIRHPSFWSRGHHMQAKVTQYSSFLLIQGLPDAGRGDPFSSLLLVKESVHAGREDPSFILLVIQRTSQEAEGTHFLYIIPSIQERLMQAEGTHFHPSSWSRGYQMRADGIHFASFLLIQGPPHAGSGDPFFILPPDPGSTTCRQRGCIFHPSSGSVTNFIISKFIITKFIRNIFHTSKTLYVTKFIRNRDYNFRMYTFQSL